MLIRHQKAFNLGIILAVSFVGVFLVIFAPIFGGGKNGLEFSDDLFNKLSKGSSYFIPRLTQDVKKFDGQSITVVVKLDKPEVLDKAVKIFLANGAQVGMEGGQMTLTADLGKVLAGILKDSDVMYQNEGKVLSEKYGIPEKEAMEIEWNVLTKTDKELKKQKKVDESNMVSEVLKKGVEPAYNYYGVQAQKVSEKALTMTALLVFYVIYTMWWGYSIFHIFEGIGLTMKKSKVKKEV